MQVRHLYVHVPFCAHRCGYCDFVTVTGREARHAPYVEALGAELERCRPLVGDAVETVFVGGGTPTLLGAPLLRRLLDLLPDAAETTVEANPETVDAPLAALLAERGCRVSLGAQSFGAEELAVLERRAAPAQVQRAVELLRRAGVARLSLDLLFGIPGQSRAALERDLERAVSLGPEHLSCYELEAKPGTRFTHRHGAALRAQAELLEDHYEHVVARLEAAGYRWYETANFCRADAVARHNVACWQGHDYLGIGVGAVSTVGLVRRRNAPRLAPYLDALACGASPPHELELLDEHERACERLMLGLRLDRPLALAGVEHVVDRAELDRLTGLGLLVREGDAIMLSRRGRMVANDVTASIIRP